MTGFAIDAIQDVDLSAKNTRDQESDGEGGGPPQGPRRQTRAVYQNRPIRTVEVVHADGSRRDRHLPPGNLSRVEMRTHFFLWMGQE